MNLGIKGKTAIVTGASKGMGYAISEGLALEGVKVMMVSREHERLAAAALKIKEKGGEVLYHVGDVADVELPETIVEKCRNEWGGVHILVNNAGGPTPGSFLLLEPSDWEKTIQTNLLSVVRFCKAVAPVFKSNQWGRIVSITSTIAKEPSPLMVLSATARAGVASFTKAISVELAPFNISANVVCPGGVITDRLSETLRAKAKGEGKNFEDVLEESKRGIPAGRFASPEEIASFVLYLVSEPGGYINGRSISVDGSLSKSYL